MKAVWESLARAWVQPPGENGGISFPKGQPDHLRHVFLDELRGSEPDFRRFAGAFDVLTEDRLNEYLDALPKEWVGNGGDLGRILDYVRALKENMDPVINHLNEALR